MAEEQKQDGFVKQTGKAAVNEGFKRGARWAAGKAAAKIGASAAMAGASAGTSLIVQAAIEAGSKMRALITRYKGGLGKVGATALAAPFILGATVVGAIGAGLAALGSAIIISVIAIPLTVAFFLLIINNSAYMVPPSTSSSVGNIFFGGDIPEGCPAPIWPVSLGQGQTYRMSQGPGGWGSHDASGGLYPFEIEAVDISKWPQGGDGSNHLVIATHSGTVAIAGVDNYGGNFVVIRADCSPEVVTNYVHMWNLNVQTGQQVQPGDVLGVMGSTGYSGGIHVHYEFLTSAGRSKNRELHPPPYMTTPYIPETPPFGCVTFSQCQIEIQ